MYAHEELRDVEINCYNKRHMNEVVKEIQANFDGYFKEFLLTEAGFRISDLEFEAMQREMGIDSNGGRRKNTLSESYKNIMREAIEAFEKNREKYRDIFDEEILEEYEDDPAAFKATVLKNECPIIHSTYYNKRAKELDKYRYDFSISDPNELLEVVTALCAFGLEYQNNIYDKNTYDNIRNFKELNMERMDTDELTVYGVIGGGIKSHMLYKVYPNAFPNRSRNALWAMWYLTGKKSFGCEMDSEFIMIDTEKNTMQQNYFYPYKLFVYYAFNIYQLLKSKAEELNAFIDPDYRYVMVDAFFNFIAEMHDDEISFLKMQIRDGGWGYV